MQKKIKNGTIFARIVRATFAERLIDVSETENEMDSNSLIELVKAKMPYGKYKGCYITDLPEYYLVWYKDKGFPKGKLGELMALQFEIQLNGLEPLLAPLKKEFRK